MPRASAASGAGRPAATARCARSRMRSRTCAMPPRRRPVARALSRRSSPAMPRRRRYAAKSKEPPVAEALLVRGPPSPDPPSPVPPSPGRPLPNARRRPRSRNSSPTRTPGGSRVQRGTRSSSRAPSRRPPVTPTSAELPNADGRGGVSRCAEMSTTRPSSTSEALASIAASRSSPNAAPPSTSAAASAPSVGARQPARATITIAAATSAPARGPVASARPAATLPMATCHGRAASSAVICP